MTNLHLTDDRGSNVLYPDCFQRPEDNSHINARSVLQCYSSHALSDLNHARLMDRVDTKFLLPACLLPTLLSQLISDYSVLEIDGKRLFTYHNTYFDTPAYDFYHMHHRGKLNRYKVRHRYYVDTQTGYLEVKFKNNRGRTIKSRIKSNCPDLNHSEATEFLTSALSCTARPSCIDNTVNQLSPAQFGSYQRIALACEASGERLTLDLNLDFESLGNRTGKRVRLPDMFIAELKQGRYNMRSPFFELTSAYGIRASQFSKYCIGCSLVTPALKANRFKPQLRALQKLH